jgi:hypothetical protein
MFNSKSQALTQVSIHVNQITPCYPFSSPLGEGLACELQIDNLCR